MKKGLDDISRVTTGSGRWLLAIGANGMGREEMRNTRVLRIDGSLYM